MYVVLALFQNHIFFVYLDLIRTQSEPLVNRDWRSLNDKYYIRLLIPKQILKIKLTARVTIRIATRQPNQFRRSRLSAATIRNLDLSTLGVELLHITMSVLCPSFEKKRLTAGRECRAIVSKRIKYWPLGTEEGMVVVQLLLSAIILPEPHVPFPTVPDKRPASSILNYRNSGQHIRINLNIHYPFECLRISGIASGARTLREVGKLDPVSINITHPKPFFLFISSP